jgi:sigma-B regulation protein RsbU (phosphoserine phosphatase)
MFSRGGRPLPLKTRGIALGMKEEVSYEKEEVTINSGDRLLIYTDGISEAMNERMEEFGEEKLQDLVQSNSDESSSEVIEKIITAVNRHVGAAAQSDDMTIVLLKRTGASS